jgi:hypothetical protein
MSNPTADRIELKIIKYEKHSPSKCMESRMVLERLKRTMTYLCSQTIEYGEAQGFEQRRGRNSEPHFSAISDF